MKRLLFLSSSLGHNGGGISSYGLDFLRVMQQSYDCFVVAGDGLSAENRYLVKEWYQLNHTNFTLKNAKQLLTIIEQVNPCIIVNSNFQIFSLVIPYLNINIFKIAISHFVDGQLAVTAGYNYRYYDKIVALSHEGKRYLEQYYGIKEKDKVRVIYNFYRSANHDTQNKIQNYPLVITFPGGGSLHKNPRLVFQILSALINTDLPFKFYWLGDTKLPGNRFFDFGKICDLLDNDERVRFTGLISREEAEDIIKSTNIFLLPSIKEGCAISLLEALSFGTIPIVANSKHASSELIDHNNTGFLFKENEPTGYIEKIKEIINNHSAFKEIYLRSKNLHQKRLSESVWTERMTDLFSIELRDNESTKAPNFLRNYHFSRLRLYVYLRLERFKKILESLIVLIFFMKIKMHRY